jgi:hypothetical protein
MASSAMHALFVWCGSVTPGAIPRGIASAGKTTGFQRWNKASASEEKGREGKGREGKGSIYDEAVKAKNMWPGCRCTLACAAYSVSRHASSGQESKKPSLERLGSAETLVPAAGFELAT